MVVSCGVSGVFGADCVCRVKAASPGLTADGKGIAPGAELPCGALLAAGEEGGLELADGMVLTLSAGSSLRIPPVLCGDTGSVQAQALSGVVRITQPESSGISIGDSIPAGFRFAGGKEAGWAVVVRAEGDVRLVAKREPPLTAARGTVLYAGESLATGAGGFAQVRLADGGVVFLGEKRRLDPPARGK